MITDGQMNVVEYCCSTILQKIANARIADAKVRDAMAAPNTQSAAYLRDIERTGRNADRILTAGIDQLKRELAKLPESPDLAKANGRPIEMATI